MHSLGADHHLRLVGLDYRETCRGRTASPSCIARTAQLVCVMILALRILRSKMLRSHVVASVWKQKRHISRSFSAEMKRKSTSCFQKRLRSRSIFPPSVQKSRRAADHAERSCYLKDGLLGEWGTGGTGTRPESPGIAAVSQLYRRCIAAVSRLSLENVIAFWQNPEKISSKTIKILAELN